MKGPVLGSTRHPRVENIHSLGRSHSYPKSKTIGETDQHKPDDSTACCTMMRMAKMKWRGAVVPAIIARAYAELTSD